MSSFWSSSYTTLVSLPNQYSNQLENLCWRYSSPCIHAFHGTINRLPPFGLATCPFNGPEGLPLDPDDPTTTLRKFLAGDSWVSIVERNISYCRVIGSLGHRWLVPMYMSISWYHHRNQKLYSTNIQLSVELMVTWFSWLIPSTLEPAIPKRQQD